MTTICYIFRDDDVLLLHRQKPGKDISEGKYLGLGGKLEVGESPRDCIIREVAEESGLVLTDPMLHGTITFPNFGGQHELMFVYTARNFSGSLMESSPEGNLEWIPRSQVMDLPMWEGDRLFLQWIFDDKFFEATFHYDAELNYQDHQVAFYPMTRHSDV